MAHMTKAMKLRIEMDTLSSAIGNLTRRHEELSSALKALETPAPPVGAWLTVEVKFFSSPHWYRYLILHVPGKGYYTTGSMDENKYFESWEKMLAYFDKDDVELRSAFHTLERDTPSYGGTVIRGSR